MLRGPVNRCAESPITQAMMRLRVLVLVVLGLFVVVAPSAHAASASTLFAQETAGGTLRKVAKDRYVLTVRPRGDVTAFADRPGRRVWRLGTSTFLSRWSLYGFAKVPPNAVLALEHAPAARDTLAVTLLSARARRDGRVAYTVVPMRGAAGALAGYAKGADGLREGRVGAGALFIDDASDVRTLYVMSEIGGRWNFAMTDVLTLRGVSGVGTTTFTRTSDGGPLCSDVDQRVESTRVGPQVTWRLDKCGIDGPDGALAAIPVTLSDPTAPLIIVTIVSGSANLENPEASGFNGAPFATTCAMAFDEPPPYSAVASAPSCLVQPVALGQ